MFASKELYFSRFKGEATFEVGFLSKL